MSKIDANTSLQGLLVLHDFPLVDNEYSAVIAGVLARLVIDPSWVFVFNGEFDPGSGRTLAACLTHASRTVMTGLALSDQWRTGE